jgi:pimeloyl-ACP methyl ester carboxylesterase
LETSDGVELATRIWPATDRARAVVVAHGLTANKDEHRVVSLSAALQREGFEVIAYDSRGHGQSGGQCTVGDLERHDVASAVALGAHSRLGGRVGGSPMGAVAVLSYAATAHDLSGVVAVSSPGEWRLPLRIRSVATAGVARTRTGREFARRRMNVRIAPSTSPRVPVRWSSGSMPHWSSSTVDATPSFRTAPGWPR